MYNLLRIFYVGSYIRQLNNLPYDKIIEVYNANKKVTLSSASDKKVVVLPDWGVSPLLYGVYLILLKKKSAV